MITQAERNKKWRKENPEKVREIARVWRKANPEKVKENSKRDYLAHRDERKAAKAARSKVYWSKSENKERRRLFHHRLYILNPVSHAVLRHASEIRAVIFKLIGSRPKRGLSLDVLYDSMMSLINEDREKAKKEFLHGIPDASVIKTEFKIGFDRLHREQLVWNVLNGHNCKVRWAKSYDDIERALRGEVNTSLLFDSYRDFILWRYERMKDGSTIQHFEVGLS
jgi:hypothetical protein